MSISITLSESPAWWEPILTTSGPLLLVIVGGYFAFRNMLAQSNITRHFVFRDERKLLYANYLHQLGNTTDAYFQAKRAPKITKVLSDGLNDAEKEFHTQTAIIKLTCPNSIVLRCNRVYKDHVSISATLIEGVKPTVSEQQQDQNYELLLEAMKDDLNAIESSKNRREYESKLKTNEAAK